MKNFFPIFFIVFLSSQGANALAWRDSSSETLATQLVEFLRQDQRVQDGLLCHLVEERCGTYLIVGAVDPRDRRERLEDCRRMAKLMIRFLDSKLFAFPHPLSHKTVHLPVVFVSDLGELAQDPRALYFLQNFMMKTDMAANGLGDVNPYELALQLTNDPAEARRFIAVLFQDTSPAKTQVQWLRQKATEESRPFVEALDHAMDRWAAIEQGSFRVTSRFLRFPNEIPELNVGRKSRAYHFYVPAYLSQRLLDSGIVSKRAAFLGPFLMNYLYECLHEGNPIARGFSEPAHFESASAWDVILGLEGSAWAMGFAGKFESSARQLRDQMMFSPQDTLVRLNIEVIALTAP